MITGIHAMFYTPEADALRLFFRDQLQMPHFDWGGGWLIFRPFEGEIGCHPDTSNSMGITLKCDDLAATMADLAARGVQFKGEVDHREYGDMAIILAPGGLEIELLQPTY